MFLAVESRGLVGVACVTRGERQLFIVNIDPVTHLVE